MRSENTKEGLKDLVTYSEQYNKYLLDKSIITPDDIFSPTGEDLEKMLIKMQNDGNMAQVQFALEKADKVIEKFKKSFWRYHLLTPGPVILVREIKTRFSMNPTIHPLLEAFDYNKTEISLSLWLYCLSFIGFFITPSLLLGVMFSSLSPWFLFSMLFYAFLLIIQVKWFETIINETSFVPLYKEIRNVIMKRIRKQQEFIENTLSIREDAYRNYQEFEKGRQLDRLDSERRKEYKKHELKSAEELQCLAHTVAIFQAESEESVQQLRNKTSLEYLKAELKIRDEVEGAHEIAIAIVDNLTKIVVAKMEILGEESKADRDMYRDLAKDLFKLTAFKQDFQKHGKKAFSEFADEFREFFEKFSKSYKGEEGFTKNHSQDGSSFKEEDGNDDEGIRFSMS